jgi:hypothetical protein
MYLRSTVRLFVLAVALTLPGVAGAFSYTGDCSDGCAADEDWTSTNANEVDTALDSLETTRTTLLATPFWVSTDNTTLSGETNLGSLTTGLILNTVAAGTATPSTYAGTSCTNQFPRSLSASGAATCATVASTDVASTLTLDADTTVTCLPTKQFFAPEGGEALSLYGVPFATTLIRYRAYILPTNVTETVTLTIRECNAGQQSCGNNDSNYTANSDGATWDTSFSDTAIDADDSVMILVNTPSGDLSGASINVDACYRRQVVE